MSDEVGKNSQSFFVSKKEIFRLKLTKVLLIENDEYLAYHIEKELKPSFDVCISKNLNFAQSLLKSKWDFIISDISLVTPYDMLEKLLKLKQSCHTLIALSSHDEESIIRLAYENGADFYFSKDDLGVLLEEMRDIQNGQLSDDFFHHSYICSDPFLKREVIHIYRGLLKGNPSLITGATGVGKTQLVKSLAKSLNLHLVSLNCSTLNHQLIEAELFGHRKGSFTGASEDKKGMLLLADKGILFLDELSHLSLETQAKLLKAVEEKSFYPIGADKEVKSDFRLITATNEDLFEQARNKKFREDLLQRICTHTCQLPTLSSRPQDIMPLLKSFNKSSKRFYFDNTATQALTDFSWPGNIRQLKNFHQFCTTLNYGKITSKEVDLFLKPHGPKITSDSEKGFEEIVDEFKRSVIRKFLAKNQGNISKTLKELSLSSRQYYNLFPKHPPRQANHRH